MPSARTRFTAEAAFLILVAGGAALARLSPLSIIAIMLVAWFLVALIERASSREQASALVGADKTSVRDQTDVLPIPEPEPAAEIADEPLEAPATQPKPRVAFRWLSWRRERAAVVPLPAPTASLEERPSRSHVRRIEAESLPPVIEVETVETEIVVAEIPAPGPAVTKRPLDLPGLEEPETVRAAAPPPPEALVAAPPVQPPPPVEPPRVERPPEPPPVERAPPPPPPLAPPVPRPPAREWNIWDLERQARQQAGDPLRDEQWTALFMNLRQYANADGVLPKEFDELVRESFSELIQAA